MVRGLFLGLAALISPAIALRGLPIPISELAKQIRAPGGSQIREATYQEYNLSVPIDHFHNDTKYAPHSNGTFNLRYWFDPQFYKPGGPVFVLSGGETSGADRLPFLEKGIVNEVAKATNGLGVILEHRYYGSSIPVPDFSTENLRFLTTEQALADTAYFAKNVVFEGLEDVSFSPEKVPWIAYGGSYAGGFVAFLRVLYPDVFFGAISSSGVVEAIWDYWEYFEGARLYAPEGCSDTTGKFVNIVDNILTKEENSKYISSLKKVFGYTDATSNVDFAYNIATGIYSLQSVNWDPAISDPFFFTYCKAVVTDKNNYTNLEPIRDTVKEFVIAGGWESEVDPLTDRFLNWIGVLGNTNAQVDEVGFYEQDDLSQTWRLWPYQVCTEWGYLQTGSGAPADILPMMSRLVDLEYSSQICKDAFNITGVANLDAINKYGGFGISYHRLAFLDGEWDPWRAAGVNALTQPKRNSTTAEPVILIDDAVHHWDENGVYPEQVTPDFPPKAVQSAKQEIKEFVAEWLKEFKPKCKRSE
ncbi:unnamed protein product [Clonostachys chloroleuca]|uniref:Uncharacterized protein n=1 Tax=Clonostachys chloroleuca TaxID=1926264 RepID=A0AA35MAF2_9HYPO|nr:unnamed protein product [Clonostachys chloroleuca]